MRLQASVCGRFTLTSTPEALAERFGLDAPVDFAPRYNAAPGQDVLSIRVPAGSRDAAARSVAWLRWGLVPHWAKDPAIGNRLINARSETLAEKPAFREALRRRRCLVPADGFYEWAPRDGGRQPHYVRRRDQALFGFAALWESWRDAAGSELETCTLITRPAVAPISALHDRMPVMLAPEAFSAWLDPQRQEADALLPLLAGAPAELICHPVSTRVNQTRFDDAECTAAVDPAPQQPGLFS